MLIRLLRKIAGLRATDFYLTCWEKGGKERRRKSSMALKYLRQKQFLQMLCKCVCFPDFPCEVLSTLLSFLRRKSSQCSVSCRIRPVH